MQSRRQFFSGPPHQRQTYSSQQNQGNWNTFSSPIPPAYQMNQVQRDFSNEQIDLSIASDFLGVYRTHLSRTLKKVDSRSFHFVIDHFSQLVDHLMNLSSNGNYNEYLHFFKDTVVDLFHPDSDISLFRLTICDYM